jgi:hypothetical protein
LREKTLKGLIKEIYCNYQALIVQRKFTRKELQNIPFFILTCRSIGFSSGFLLFTVCIPRSYLEKRLKKKYYSRQIGCRPT